MHKIVPGYSPTQEARARVRSYGRRSAVAANLGALQHAGGCVHTATRAWGLRTAGHVVQHKPLDCSLLLLVLRMFECDSRVEMLVMDRGGGWCLQMECCACPDLPSFKVHLGGSRLAALTDRSVWGPHARVCMKTSCPRHLHQGKLAAV